MGLPVAEARAHLVAGVRETFEESGVWLGEGDLPESERAPLARGDKALVDVLEAHDARIDLDRVTLWSWWITPEAEPRRYDTRFLVAHIEERLGRHDDSETVASGWFRPRDLVTQPISSFPLAPPTWWTLSELTPFDTVAGVLKAASLRPHAPIQPVMRFSEAGMELLLPGHPDHPADAIVGVPEQVTFVDGCWVALRDGVPVEV
jgi:hypothetical protein